ncbi:MAG: PAS domain-containing protein, partial [Bacteroidales bacterium]|nr:PAS domain-containing protein [Bacteroidales bacterium]
MSGDTNIAETKLDELNRGILLQIIERNEFLRQKNSSVQEQIAEFRVDGSGKFIEVNDRFATLLGYESKEDLLEWLQDGNAVYHKNDLSEKFSKKDFFVNNPIFLRSKNGDIVELRESMLKTKVGNRVV